MFQAALTVHDIDANSAIGSSIITDDRSSYRFKEVSVYYHNGTNVQKQVIFVKCSNSSSVMPAVRMHNIESEEIIHVQNHANMVG